MHALCAAAGILLAVAAQAAPPPEEGRPRAERDYVVGVADRLRIVVWGEPDLSLIVSVRPDGKITVPLANDVAVAGLTPEQIRREITTRLSTLVRDPHVTVIVDEINSFRVYFLGEITGQGVVNFFRPTRLLQAVAEAGGLTPFSKKKITLVREEDGVEKRYEIDYKQLAAGEKNQENMFLMPGDLLICE
jgi:polysaccharide export outer membrane protein